ncbi:MAG: ABC transporter permease [Actinobacteria bacterium]|nr:ABC transporter permease [Actinomycetota bacterium]MDI6830580.1 ABC transporter permease [Actinomycetota bacterium]
MRKALAFLKRDFLIETSYRFNFLLSLAGMVFSVTIFYFAGRIVDPSYVSGTADDYFSFALVGMAMAMYLRAGLGSFAESVREEQMMGTLEAMMATPTSLTTIVLSSALWRFLLTSISVLAYLLLGAAFGVSYAGANLPAALLLLALTVASYAALGIISAAFIIVFKRGDPINWAVSSLSILLGGVFFPYSVLPGWMQFFSRLLPMTWSLDGIRSALLKGAGLASLWRETLALAAIAAALIPLSLALFGLAVRHARRTGSLVKY